jgi:uncharacterized protein YdhG (YjbR/CyaY superfamily)
MRRDARVDAYVSDAPEGWRDALAALRDACLEELVGFTESMAYRMPGYERDGQIEVGFAGQKRYISLYILRTDVTGAHRGRLDGLDVGKGCIRYPTPEGIDMKVVRSMLRATAASTGKVC